MHIEKLYFTLPEVIARWRISDTDLVYLAENDKLRLSVRVFHAPVEFGDIEEGADGERFRALHEDFLAGTKPHLTPLTAPRPGGRVPPERWTAEWMPAAGWVARAADSPGWRPAP